ncbi:MAG: (2Fe-2S)-binding protein [Propionivibrio sp.]|uniref:(2Fe-2S)-binding protein n=1 Tax=Propionivibrio sp. TaxID=2212460 RepID=UPI001A46E9E9|nr:(2Fe-2S)-binding protein [Propionivibrio sp.]MBL8413201.1 (2Fe-2S)-binding protein [Propionivibrio sp.]
MYVCVCKAITDHQIREAAQNGALTLDDLRRDLGIASECGNCAAYARQLLEETIENQCKAAWDSD